MSIQKLDKLIKNRIMYSNLYSKNFVVCEF